MQVCIFFFDPDKPGCFVVLYLPVSYKVLDTPSASLCAPEGQMWRAEAAQNPAAPLVVPVEATPQARPARRGRRKKYLIQVVRNSESDTYTLVDIARHSAAVDPLAFKNSTSTQYQVMSSPRSRIMVLATGADEWLPVGRLWHDSGASPCVMATAYASKMGLLVQPSKTQLTFADAHQGKGAMELVDGLSIVFNPDQPEVKVHTPTMLCHRDSRV